MSDVSIEGLELDIRHFQTLQQGERFGKVIVRAFVQFLYQVFDVGPRGKYQDGRALFLPQASQEFDTVDAGQHPVEQDYVKVELQRHM